MTPSDSEVKSGEVPTVSELTVGDEMDNGPSNHILTDENTTLYIPHHVQAELPNENASNLCIMQLTSDKEKTRPFTHFVGLKGKKGIVTNIEGLFNEGAMVNLIY